MIYVPQGQAENPIFLNHPYEVRGNNSSSMKNLGCLRFQNPKFIIIILLSQSAMK